MAPPTRSTADTDAAYLEQRAADHQRPDVLAGHSYGGVIITNAAGNPNVKALIHIAAFVPDTGDTIGGLQTQIPGSKAPKPCSTSAPTRCPTARPAPRAKSNPTGFATSSPPNHPTRPPTRWPPLSAPDGSTRSPNPRARNRDRTTTTNLTGHVIKPASSRTAGLHDGGCSAPLIDRDQTGVTPQGGCH